MSTTEDTQPGGADIVAATPDGVSSEQMAAVVARVRAAVEYDPDLERRAREDAQEAQVLHRALRRLRVLDRELARRGVTDADLRQLFAEHCECRPLNTARTSHSHDCEDGVTEDVRIALHGFVVDDGEPAVVSDFERAAARARCAALVPRHRTTMTIRQLSARLRELTAAMADDQLDALVCVRVEDDEGFFHAGGLHDVEVDAGCGDEEQLILDGAQDVADPPARTASSDSPPPEAG